MLKFKWEKYLKKTEIEEIPEEWVISNLGNRNYFDIIPSGIDKFSGTKEYLSTRSVQEAEITEIEEVITFSKRPSRANMQPVEDSVWLARMINSLKVLKADEDLIKNKILSTGFLGIKTKENYLADYLYYYFLTPQFQEYKDSGYVTGGVQESLTSQGAELLPVPILDINEQYRITTVLSWLDRLIKNKKRQIETLEKTASAIFKGWFIDFEPFKNRKFVTSKIGKIPCSWEIKPIGEIADLKNGFPYKSEEKFSEPIDESYAFINLNNVTQSGNFKADYAWIKSDRLSENHFLEEGDLIVANVHFGVGGAEIERLLGAPALVTFPDEYELKKAAYSMDITRILPAHNRYVFYLYLYLKFTKEDSASFSTGTSVLHLDIGNFKLNKLILKPSDQILDKFDELVRPLFQKIVVNQKQIMTLRKTFDSLLPLLIFGKLRVESL